MDINLDASKLDSSYGILITYNTPKEKRTIVESLKKELEGFQKRNISKAKDFSPAISSTNCIDISGQKDIILADQEASKQVTGWIKSYKMIILCKSWEWELIQRKNGRWVSHLTSIYDEYTSKVEEAAKELVETKNISDRINRLVIHEYLSERSLFNRYLEEKNISTNQLQRIISDKGLWSLDEFERDLLLKSNSDLLRYVVVQELRSGQQRFNRQEFINLFGEIPRQINLESDNRVFQDILENISPEQSEMNQFVDIEVLAGILRKEDFEKELEESISQLIETNNISKQVQEIEDKENFLQRCEYICSHLETEIAESGFSALSTLVYLENIEQDSVTSLNIQERYEESVKTKHKIHVTSFLVQKLKKDQFSSVRNHKQIADFLNEEGPKIVILLDGLPLAISATQQFLQNRDSDERWEIKQGIAPVPSVTKSFMRKLNAEYDFSRLNNSIEAENRLKPVDLDAFIGEEKEEQLWDVLQQEDSIILYDPEIDRGGHYPTDIHRKAENYLQDKIPQFIDKYGEYADILITSDHGMVETYPSNAIPRPNNASQRSMKHCRATFADDKESAEGELTDSNVSYIEVGLPDNDRECMMVNPNNPSAKFGEQNSDLWIHGGISIEESIVPVAIWRRE